MPSHLFAIQLAPNSTRMSSHFHLLLFNSLPVLQVSTISILLHQACSHYQDPSSTCTDTLRHIQSSSFHIIILRDCFVSSLTLITGKTLLVGTALLYILFPHHSIQQHLFTVTFTPLFTSSYIAPSASVKLFTSVGRLLFRKKEAGTLCQQSPHSPILPLIFAYLPHLLTMSHQMTTTSISTGMTDSEASQTNWLPLIQPRLFNQATRKYGSVVPDTKCSVIYGPEVSIQDPTNVKDYWLTEVACIFRRRSDPGVNMLSCGRLLVERRNFYRRCYLSCPLQDPRGRLGMLLRGTRRYHGSISCDPPKAFSSINLVTGQSVST